MMKVVNKIFHLAILGSSILPSPTFLAEAFSTSLQSLLTTHQSDIASLKEVASKVATSANESVLPPTDVYYLRYILNDSYEDDTQRREALTSNLQWRMNEGNPIVTCAANAIEAATADGKWNNDPVRNGAPHAALINDFITTNQCITTSVPTTNDLLYCIRAGKIDDAGLMSTVTVDQMVDFFLYIKEVNAMVADLRSVQTNSLVKVVTCQDMNGLKLVGGSKDFQKALSVASKKANDLYPSLNGRTLMLNLPPLVRPLVKIFKLLLPKAVTERLRFENGPLKNVEDLREIGEGGVGRGEFVDQVNDLAYGD